MRRPVSDGMLYAPKVSTCLKAQINQRRPAMKKVSTAAAKQSRNISQQRLTIGLDLGDRNRCYCVLDEAGGSSWSSEFGRLRTGLVNAARGLAKSYANACILSRLLVSSAVSRPLRTACNPRLIRILGHRVA